MKTCTIFLLVFLTVACCPVYVCIVPRLEGYVIWNTEESANAYVIFEGSVNRKIAIDKNDFTHDPIYAFRLQPLICGDIIHQTNVTFGAQGQGRFQLELFGMPYPDGEIVKLGIIRIPENPEVTDRHYPDRRMLIVRIPAGDTAAEQDTGAKSDAENGGEKCR